MSGSGEENSSGEEKQSGQNYMSGSEEDYFDKLEKYDQLFEEMKENNESEDVLDTLKEMIDLEKEEKRRYLETNSPSLREQLGKDFYNQLRENEAEDDLAPLDKNFRGMLKEREMKNRYFKGMRKGELDRRYLDGPAHDWEYMDVPTNKLQRNPKEDVEILLKDDIASWSTPAFSHHPKKASLGTMGRNEATTLRPSRKFNNFQQWKKHIDVYNYWWHQATSARWHSVQVQEELFELMPQLREVLRDSFNKYSSQKFLASFTDEYTLSLITSTIELGKSLLSNSDRKRVEELHNQLINCKKHSKASYEGFSQALGFSYSLQLTPNAYAHLSNAVYAKMAQIREIEDQKLKFINDKEHSFIKTQHYLSKERLNMNKMIVWLESKKITLQNLIEKHSNQEKMQENLKSLLNETQNLLERKIGEFEKSFGVKPDLLQSSMNERECRDIYSRKTEQLFHRLSNEYSEQRDRDLEERCESISSKITQKYNQQYSSKNDLLKKISIYLLNLSDDSFEDRWNFIFEKNFEIPFFKKIISNQLLEKASNSSSIERRKIWSKYIESMKYNIHFDNLSPSELLEVISVEDSFFDYCISKNPSQFDEMTHPSKFRISNYFSNYAEWFEDFHFQKSSQLGVVIDPNLRLKGMQRRELDLTYLKRPTPQQFLMQEESNSNPLRLLEFYNDIANPLNRIPKKMMDSVDSEDIKIVPRTVDNTFESTQDIFSILGNFSRIGSENNQESTLQDEIFNLIKINKEEKSFVSSYQQIQNFLFYYRYEPLSSLLENFQQQGEDYLWTENKPWIDEIPEFDTLEPNNTTVYQLESNLPLRHSLFLIEQNQNLYKDQWAQLLNLYLSNVIPSVLPGYRWVVKRDSLATYYADGKNKWHNKEKYSDGFIRIPCYSFSSNTLYSERYICLNLEKGIMSVQLVRQETINHGYRSVYTKYKRRDFLTDSEDDNQELITQENQPINEGDSEGNLSENQEENIENRDIDGELDKLIANEIRERPDNIPLYVPRPFIEKSDAEKFNIEYDIPAFWLSQFKKYLWPDNQYLTEFGRQFTHSIPISNDSVHKMMQNETTPF